MIFKVEAEGDVLYIRADNRGEAEGKLRSSFGDIPADMLTWTENVELPENEVCI